MKIGLDLDNTIVDCEAMFEKQSEQLLGSSLTGRTREDIRALVRETYGDNRWTQIQAEVYGPLYHECEPCPRAIETIAMMAASPAAFEIVIVSHKTLTDSAGKNYKLRDNAFDWIKRHIINNQTRISAEQVFFTHTIDEKRQMIVNKGCDIFFDDLLEIILPLQNKISHPVLFSKSPDKHSMRSSLHVCDWSSFGKFVCND